MSTTLGYQIGRAIFYLLKNESDLMSITGMSDAVIQPAPMREQSNTNIGITYEINAVNPVNVKRISREEGAPLFNVTFTLECFHRVYHDSINLADFATRAMCDNVGTFNSIKIDGIALETMQETYNKERRYYSKLLTFDARVLL